MLYLCQPFIDAVNALKYYFCLPHDIKETLGISIYVISIEIKSARYDIHALADP
jgi:hypothetical protein